jgi:sec-independent protein translocase protein TatA
MLGGISWQEILVVLIIALIVFGPKRLPELGHSLGKGIREFRSSLSGERGDEDRPVPTDEIAANGEIAAKDEIAAKGEERPVGPRQT